MAKKVMMQVIAKMLSALCHWKKKGKECQKAKKKTTSRKKGKKKDEEEDADKERA